MAEAYYIGVYWGVRRETVDDCARRVSEFFSYLSQVDPLLSIWYKQGSSHKLAKSHPILINEVQVRNLLLSGRNRGDFEGEIIEELGFRIGLWNGRSDEYSVGIGIKCGAFSPFIPNSCVIDLPYQEINSKSFIKEDLLINIMKNIVNSWEPDWGVVNSNQHLNTLPENTQNSPLVGWMTYISRHRGSLRDVELPGRKITIENKGDLLILTEDPFSAYNSNHIAAAVYARNQLAKANLLGPLK